MCYVLVSFLISAALFSLGVDSAPVLLPVVKYVNSNEAMKSPEFALSNYKANALLREPSLYKVKDTALKSNNIKDSSAADEMSFVTRTNAVIVTGGTLSTEQELLISSTEGTTPAKMRKNAKKKKKRKRIKKTLPFSNPTTEGTSSFTNEDTTPVTTAEAGTVSIAEITTEITMTTNEITDTEETTLTWATQKTTLTSTPEEISSKLTTEETTLASTAERITSTSTTEETTSTSTTKGTTSAAMEETSSTTEQTVSALTTATMKTTTSVPYQTISTSASTMEHTMLSTRIETVSTLANDSSQSKRKPKLQIRISPSPSTAEVSAKSTWKFIGTPLHHGEHKTPLANHAGMETSEKNALSSSIVSKSSTVKSNIESSDVYSTTPVTLSPVHTLQFTSEKEPWITTEKYVTTVDSASTFSHSWPSNAVSTFISSMHDLSSISMSGSDSSISTTSVIPSAFTISSATSVKPPSSSAISVKPSTSSATATSVRPIAFSVGSETSVRSTASASSTAASFVSSTTSVSPAPSFASSTTSVSHAASSASSVSPPEPRVGPKSKNEKGSMSAGAVCGMVVLALFMLTCVSILVFTLRRYKCRRNVEDSLHLMSARSYPRTVYYDSTI